MGFRILIDLGADRASYDKLDPDTAKRLLVDELAGQLGEIANTTPPLLDRWVDDGFPKDTSDYWADPSQDWEAYMAQSEAGINHAKARGSEIVVLQLDPATIDAS